jgi:nitroreductase
MDVVEAIRTRKSIRRFKSDPVPKEVMAELLEIAGRAPSAMNTQPWEFVVLAGEVLKKIERANLDQLRSGVPRQPEHTVIGWQRGSVYWDRQVELAKQIFTLMDIPRNDKEKRAQWLERGFRYFDAPAAILLLTDKALSADAPLLDLGAVIQTICLAALNYGLGTCIEDQGTGFPEILRRLAPIPDSKRIIISIAIGYPDWEFAGNKLETTRRPLENYVTWCGY